MECGARQRLPRLGRVSLPLIGIRRVRNDFLLCQGAHGLAQCVALLGELVEANRADLNSLLSRQLGVVKEAAAGQTISYSELGIYRLLLQIGDMHQLWHFAEDVLGALIEYDARHKIDLVGTLSIYLNQRESLKQTARVLRVHVNTVSYRIQRIEQLTSLDLANPDHRLSAHVAAKIIESRQAGGH